MYSPAGFRRAPLLRHRRGMGDAASDYASIAAKLTPGSAMYQLFSGCAANPTAPACASATAGALQGPYLTADQEAAVRSAQAAGAIPPTFAATVGPPPGTQLPTPVAASTPSAPVSGGNVNISFSTSSGNSSNPSVGDKWTVSISGARPHDPVSVSGGQNGASNDSYLGRADASGNFTKSGTFTADQVGSWVENWYVNGVVAGTWTFFVTSPAPPAMQPAGFQSPNPPAGSTPQQQIQQQGASSQTGTSASFFSQTAFGIPVWILLAAGVGAFFVFGQQGGHYGR